MKQESLAARSFDGQYKHGYCAIGREGGRRATAHVVITKSREAFPHVVKMWEKQHEDVREVRRLLEDLGQDSEASGVELKKPRLN